MHATAYASAGGNASMVADEFDADLDLTKLLQDVPALAARMGLRPGTLYNKADAGDDSHNQPTLRDVVQVTHLTGSFSVLDALNEMFGRASFDCVTHGNTSDEELLTLVTQLAAENGEFHRELGDGLRAKRFTPDALRLIRAEGFDMVAALMTLLSRLEDYVDDEAGR